MATRAEAVSKVFRNDQRPKIVRFLSKKKNGAYVSQIAQKLGMSKGSAFVNLSELEKAGILVHNWELAKGTKTPKAVKVYTLNTKYMKETGNVIQRVLKEI